MRLTFAMKLVTVLLTGAVGLTALGGGVAWAASDSLPGDTLYPVKLAAEDARLAFASAPGNQVGLALQFAEERVEEIQALAAAGRRVPDETVARMEQHTERARSSADVGAGASDGSATSPGQAGAGRARLSASI